MQKNAFTTFFKDFSDKINSIYTENQKKLNKIYEESKETIDKINEFMNKLKIDISNRFKNEYNDIENFDELNAEIKERVSKFELPKVNKKEISDLKKIS